MKFRQDIQILRGIAVLFVVLFHLELAGLSSGFLGVDVFFVVSGFLMAILYKEGQTKEFFVRRAKRLLPAYFATVILTLFASLFLILPSELGQVATQSIYSVFFANNIGFWMQNSYFSKSDFNPLLHLWSLGVEIQFYLITPLLVWFFSKSKFLLPITLISSLVLCVFIVGISPKTSFFMMPLRAWEFLIGFMVATYFTINGNIKYKNLSGIGLVGFLCLIIIFFCEVHGDSLSVIDGHPSMYALLVCLATAIIITFGMPATIVTSILGRFMIKIGNYSYSIYLVHFPIIVLYLYDPFSGTKLHTDSYIDKAILFIVIAVSSILMHRYVEIRKVNKVSKVYFISAVAIVCLAALTKVVPNFYSDEQQNIFNGLSDRGIYRCGKVIRITDPGAITCKVNSSEHQSSVMLVGNSHSDSIKNVFSEIMDENQYNTYFFVSNNPMFAYILPPQEIIDEAISKNVTQLFLHYKSGSLDLDKLDELTVLGKQHNIKITVILPVPIYEQSSVPKMLFEGQKPSQTYAQYLQANQDIINKSHELKSKYSNFDYLEVGPIFCNPICAISNEAKNPYYFDGDHLTITGSELLRDAFKNIFKH